MGLFDAVGKVFSGLGNAATGGLFDVGASLISGIAQNKAQKSANEANIEMARQNNAAQMALAEKNNQFQLDAMRENNAFNKQMAIDMFNLENSYNTPYQQMARLREAGINPAVALGGNAVSVANTGNAQTPSASGSGISPQLPSLTTPHIDAVPPMSMGFIDALSSLSQTMLNKSKSKEAEANSFAISESTQAKIASLWADARNKDAMAAYNTTLNNLNLLYGDEERQGNINKLVNEVKKLYADYTVALQEEKYTEAKKLFEEAKTRLTDSQNQQVKELTPIIVDNAKKEGRLLVESANNQRAQAKQANANAAYTKESAETARQMRPHLVSAQEALAKEEKAKAKVAESTTMEQIQHWRNGLKLDDKRLQQIDEAIRKAKKENSWFEVREIVKIAQTISSEALGWASLGVSKIGTSTHTEHYDANGDMTGFTDSVNRYLYE